jgi:hypothetical protein
MTKKLLVLVFVFIFVFGWFCSSVYSNVLSQISVVSAANDNLEMADSNSFVERYFFNNKERISPSDWIKQDQIDVFRDRVVINLDNPQWAVFTDTNSMDPVIDANAHAIEIIPQSPDQINVGDIVSYDSSYVDGAVIHRVIEIGEDEGGWYCRTKGDNNALEDPGKIRFNQILRVLVAIIY